MELGIYSAYFLDSRVVASFVLQMTSVLLLYLFFRRNSNPQTRSWSLGLMLLSSIFFWMFLGLSLTLCYAFGKAYESHEETIVTMVFGQALLLAAVIGLPFAILLRRFSPLLVLAKAKTLALPALELRDAFDRLQRKMDVPRANLRICKSAVPISFALHSKEPLVVVSERLVQLLKKDELEAVMAHELAHIKNSDTVLKALVTAYKTALPHDPIIRFVEAAFHREREIVADETAVNVTGKPLSLASALLKIYQAFPRGDLRSYGTFSILGSNSSLLKRHPPIINRVNHLIYLAQG